MTMPDVNKSSDFEKWLRSVCFQAPPEHCYDLAKSAWEASQSKVDELLEKQREACADAYIKKVMEHTGQKVKPDNMIVAAMFNAKIGDSDD